MFKKEGIRLFGLFCLLQIFCINFAQIVNSQTQISNIANADFSTIEKDFVSPPENFRAGACWYWMNNHISKEDVINDLKAMKKAGITRVLLGSDIVSGNDFGKVKVFSPEWYEVMHTMLKTATELDIEVGRFNCPSWSQAGGPWIKPENRYCRTNHPYMTNNMGGDEPYREQPSGLLGPVMILNHEK
jgi:hypothetical protein